MRKILTILLLLVSFSGMAQQTFKRQEIIADTVRVKKLSADPDSILNYSTIWDRADSLRFMDVDGVKYNLLDKYTKAELDALLSDSLLLFVRYTDSTTIYVTPTQVKDSLLPIKVRLLAIEDDTTHFLVAWDSVAIFHQRLDWHTDSLLALYNTSFDQDIWQKDSDSTTSSKYPVNLSSLRLPPDSRVLVGNLPNVSAPYADTLSIGYILSGEYIFRLFGISDGAGGLTKYGIKVLGLIEADSTNIGYIKGDSVDVGKFLLNGTDIRVTGTLDTVAYQDQDNNFSVDQTIQGRLNATDVHATDSISAVNLFASGLVKTVHFQLTTTPSNGYVLKCDADGNGSWQEITNAYKGTWNAHTNTPTLADGVGTTGDFYLVLEGDTVDLGSGNVIFLTGGTAIYNGAEWEAINPSQIVVSVNGLIDDVQLDLIASGDTLWITGATDSINLEQIPAIGNLQDSITKHKGWYYSLQDSVVANMDSITKHSTWYYSLRDSVRSTMDSIVNHTVRYYDVLDSLSAHRTLIDNHTDSITKHSGWYYSLRDSVINNIDSISKIRGWYYTLRDSVINNMDSITKHTGWYYSLRDSVIANMDSIVNHTIRYYELQDSIADHRTELDNLADSITAHRDTLSDYRDRILNYEQDSAFLLHWADTISKIATKYDLDTLSFIYDVDLDGIRDTLGFVYDSLGLHKDTLVSHNTRILALMDSILLHRDTLDNHYTRLSALEADSANWVHFADSLVTFVTPSQLTDSLDIVRDTTGDHAGRIVALESATNSQDIWQKDSDSTASAKYPVNLASLRFPPDSRIMAGVLSNQGAGYGDTLSIGYILSGEYLFKLFGISDGAGGTISRGLLIDGNLSADSISGANLKWDSAYGWGNHDTAGYMKFTDTLDYVRKDSLAYYATQKLDNLDNVAINKELLPKTTDSLTVGSVDKTWAGLFLSDTAKIDFAGDNTPVGHLSLLSNTTGSKNSAFGYWSLRDNTEGISNTGIGYSTLRKNTTGSYNTAIGGTALWNNTTASNNTAIGYNALYALTSGEKNVALGFAAGLGTATFPIDNTSSTASLFLGFDAIPFESGGTNEIVIGANAIGRGSNTATIGDTLITETYLSGNGIIGDQLKITTINTATTNLGYSLVDSSGYIKRRTGAGLFADIGLNDSLALFARLTGATFSGKVTVNDSIVGTNQRITGTGYFGDDLTLADASTLKIGTDADLQIYNSGTSTIFKAAGDMLFGNSSSASDAMRIFYNSGFAYVSCRFNGDETFYTGAGGLYMPAGQAIYLNSTPLLKRGTNAGTDPATWDADDLYGVTRKSIKAYVSANASGGSGVTSVTATSPLASSGGITPDISLGTVTYANGGTGLTSIAAGSILAANSANTYTAINSTSGTKYLRNVSGTVGWALESDLIVQTVTNGQTTTAPSQDAVFDQLTTKADKAMFAHQDLTMAAGASSWDCSAGQNATLAITGNVTLTLSKLTAGTSGNLSIINPGGAYTITVAHASAIIKISSSIKSATATFTVTSGGFDVFSWYYDGEYLWWNGTKGYQ
jgi:hypothetical protein